MGNEDAVSWPAPEVKSLPECINSSNPFHECSNYCLRKIAEARQRLGGELPGSRKRPAEQHTVHPDCADPSDPHHHCSEHRVKRVADAKSGLERGEQQPTAIAAAGKSNAVAPQPDYDGADKQEDAGAAAGSGFRPPVPAILGGSRGRGAFPWTFKAAAGLEMDLSSSDDEDKILEFARNQLLINQQCGALACMLAAAAVLEEAGTDAGLEEEDEHIGGEGDEGDEGDVVGGHDESSISTSSRKSSSSTCGTSLMSPIIKMMKEVLESIRTTNALVQRVMLGELRAESIKEVMRLTVESGATVGSVEHFMATILFVKAEYRAMFMTFTTKEARFGWLKRWCQQSNMY